MPPSSAPTASASRRSAPATSSCSTSSRSAARSKSSRTWPAGSSPRQKVLPSIGNDPSAAYDLSRGCPPASRTSASRRRAAHRRDRAHRPLHAVQRSPGPVRPDHMEIDNTALNYRVVIDVESATPRRKASIPSCSACRADSPPRPPIPPPRPRSPRSPHPTFRVPAAGPDHLTPTFRVPLQLVPTTLRQPFVPCSWSRPPYANPSSPAAGPDHLNPTFRSCSRSGPPYANLSFPLQLVRTTFTPTFGFPCWSGPPYANLSFPALVRTTLRQPFGFPALVQTTHANLSSPALVRPPHPNPSGSPEAARTPTPDLVPHVNQDPYKLTLVPQAWVDWRCFFRPSGLKKYRRKGPHAAPPTKPSPFATTMTRPRCRPLLVTMKQGNPTSFRVPFEKTMSDTIARYPEPKNEPVRLPPAQPRTRRPQSPGRHERPASRGAAYIGAAAS